MGQASQSARDRRAAEGRAARGPADPDGRYGLLLLVLVSIYLLSAFGTGRLAERLQLALFAAVLLVALRTSQLGRRQTTMLAVMALIGSAAAVAAALTNTQTGAGIGEIWSGLILLSTAVLIVRRVLARPTVTVQSIYGALSAYLITGFMFAAGYAAIEHLSRAPFFADGQPASTQTFQYFSFTTLTTLGYGDFTAAGTGGRAIAVIEALVGQVFLATLVARLVAAFRAPGEASAERASPAKARRRPPSTVRRRDLAPYRRSRNHPRRVMPAPRREPQTARRNDIPPFPESHSAAADVGGHDQDGC